MPTTTTGNGRVLNKRHAVVHTASIDVKIMRLDKKQVTMSVFRQLPERSIFADEVSISLRGTPWGIVRYVWKDCPEWADCHLVWQQDDELFRMPLFNINTCLSCEQTEQFLDHSTDSEWWSCIPRLDGSQKNVMCWNTPPNKEWFTEQFAEDYRKPETRKVREQWLQKTCGEDYLFQLPDSVKNRLRAYEYAADKERTTLDFVTLLSDPLPEIMDGAREMTLEQFEVEFGERHRRETWNAYWKKCQQARRHLEFLNERWETVQELVRQFFELDQLFIAV